MFAAADAMAIVAASYLAWFMRVWRRGDPLPDAWEEWFKQPFLFYTVPIGLYVFSVFGLYRPRRDRSLWGEQGSVIKASLVATGAVVLALWVTGSALAEERSGPALGPWGWADTPAKVQLTWLAIILPAFVGLQRAMVRIGLRILRARGWNLRHVAIIGTGRLGQIACRTLDRNSWTGISVSYFIGHHPRTSRTSCLNRPVLGGLCDLEKILEERPPDAVYLALPSRLASEIPDVLQRLERFPVDVRIVPDVSPRYVPQSMSVSELEGMPILSYRESPLQGLGGFTKRFVDVVGALVALVIFAPLMVLIAILIKLTSPGPVLFRQRRVSLGGSVFEIYKFRTMYADERGDLKPNSGGEGIDGWTQREDPRITPVGRWLRRTSLDELPQLFNVLRGQMSLVGPRPERPELIERFREDWRGYMLRQHVKAGMTGWAQVHGLRGQTSLRKRLQYDLFYVRHWSLWFDVRILFMTIYRGFVHRNAH
ncbi:MAG: undecaprenyl-phosphate glucose phosphotransferase [Planctomycetota bacterium]|nr:MAG: undecaprenyl-phosphate glucose phosphotransferase [Planctomycetota bacterium]